MTQVAEQVLEYPVVIELDGDVYAVRFPDVPGCFSQGNTLEEARRNAQDALESHLDVLREHGQPIPAPSSFVGTIRVKAS